VVGIDSVLDAVNVSGSVQIAAVAAMVLLSTLAVIASRRYGRFARTHVQDVALPPTADSAPAADDGQSDAIAHEVGTNPWSDAIRRLEENEARMSSGSFIICRPEIRTRELRISICKIFSGRFAAWRLQRRWTSFSIRSAEIPPPFNRLPERSRPTRD